MNRIAFILLFLISLISCFAENVIICPPTNGSGVTLYNEEALIKGKFDDKNISIDIPTLFNIPVSIGEPYLKGKDIIQPFTINGKKVAMYFPYKLKDKDNKRGCKPFAKYDRHVEFGGGYSNPQREGYPFFSWYPYDSFEQIRNLKDSVVYFTGPSEFRKRGYENGRPYKITKLEFSNTHDNGSLIESDRFKNLFISLYPNFKVESGRYPSPLHIKPYGWAPSYGWSNSAIDIKDFLSYFISYDDFKRKRIEQYSDSVVTNFKTKYIGKEVYINCSPRIIESKKELKYGYWIVDSFTFKLPVTGLPCSDFSYYVHLTSPNSPAESFEVLLSDITDIELADLKRERQARQEIEESQKKKEQELQDEKELKELENELARKFGRSNAKLIMDGKVRLGWTKQMCEESWGTPYDSTRVTTRFGTAEAWWYGDGSILYFQGNKLVMIQE